MRMREFYPSCGGAELKKSRCSDEEVRWVASDLRAMLVRIRMIVRTTP